LAYTANLRNQMPSILKDAKENLTPRMRNLLDPLAGVETVGV
jgi:ribosomal protein S30